MNQLKFSAHLDLFFATLPPAKRIERFRELGFKAFELWCWWDYDLADLAAAAEKNHMTVAAVCTRFVSLVDDVGHEDYLAGLKETIAACQKLNCKTIISQVGAELKNCDRTRQKKNLIAGLKKAGQFLAGTDLTLVVEPLNILVDHKGYFLSFSAEAAEIINAVNSRNIRLLFDVYHQQITEGNLTLNIRNYAPLIAHYHIADHPGRHHPGSGEICYPFILDEIARTGYQGYIGLEWIPQGEEQPVLKDFLHEFGDLAKEGLQGIPAGRAERIWKHGAFRNV